MYRLRDLKNGQYQFHVKDGIAFEGNIRSVMKKCVKELRFDPQEIEDAVIDLHTSNTDYAEFGVFKRFMYSLKDEKVA